MRIQYASDLHLEFDKESRHGDLRCLFDDVGADVLVLAGDIDNIAHALTFAGRCAQELQIPAIFVAGNHEYYGKDITEREAFQSYVKAGVHWLDKGSVIIDGVRFLGCTLWTDFCIFGENETSDAIQDAEEWSADYSQSYMGGNPFRPGDAIALHREERAWLEGELEKPERKTVVVTHHAPHRNSIGMLYADEISTANFVSDLDALMGSERANAWIHGHTHDSFRYEVRGTHVRCNPRGYPREHDLYKKEAFIDI